jgi:hypothetical protein
MFFSSDLAANGRCIENPSGYESEILGKICSKSRIMAQGRSDVDDSAFSSFIEPGRDGGIQWGKIVSARQRTEKHEPSKRAEFPHLLPPHSGADITKG